VDRTNNFGLISQFPAAKDTIGSGSCTWNEKKTLHNVGKRWYKIGKFVIAVCIYNTAYTRENTQTKGHV